MEEIKKIDSEKDKGFGVIKRLKKIFSYISSKTILNSNPFEDSKNKKLIEEAFGKYVKYIKKNNDGTYGLTVFVDNGKTKIGTPVQYISSATDITTVINEIKGRIDHLQSEEYKQKYTKITTELENISVVINDFKTVYPENVYIYHINNIWIVEVTSNEGKEYKFVQQENENLSMFLSRGILKIEEEKPKKAPDEVDNEVHDI